jgi:hypothetical protein
MNNPAASYGVSTAVIPEACLPVGRSVNRESRNHVALYISEYPLEPAPEFRNRGWV